MAPLQHRALLQSLQLILRELGRHGGRRRPSVLGEDASPAGEGEGAREQAARRAAAGLQPGAAAGSRRRRGVAGGGGAVRGGARAGARCGGPDGGAAAPTARPQRSHCP